MIKRAEWLDHSDILKAQRFPKKKIKEKVIQFPFDHTCFF